jgi:hypothetical protein
MTLYFQVIVFFSPAFRQWENIPVLSLANIMNKGKQLENALAIVI